MLWHLPAKKAWALACKKTHLQLGLRLVPLWLARTSLLEAGSTPGELYWLFDIAGFPRCWGTTVSSLSPAMEAWEINLEKQFESNAFSNEINKFLFALLECGLLLPLMFYFPKLLSEIISVMPLFRDIFSISYFFLVFS